MKNAAILLLSCFAAGIHAGPVTPRVSNEQSPAAILATLKQVADWQLGQPLVHPPDDWTYGACYAGLNALSDIADDPKYHNALVEMGARQLWKPGLRIYHADDHCVAQTYLDIYLQHRDPAMLEPVRQEFEEILAGSKTNVLRFITDASAERWTWCDALFMGPPTWVRLYNATGDHRYLQYMDREWRATREALYDPAEHLVFQGQPLYQPARGEREKSFLEPRQRLGPGRPGANVAESCRRITPHRNFYEQQFKDMAAKIASLQQPDGLWRASLLDPESYPAEGNQRLGLSHLCPRLGHKPGNPGRALPTNRWSARPGRPGQLRHRRRQTRTRPTHRRRSRRNSIRPILMCMVSGAFLLAGSETLPARPGRASRPPPTARLCPSARMISPGKMIASPTASMARPGDAAAKSAAGIDVWVKRTRKPDHGKMVLSGHLPRRPR